MKCLISDFDDPASISSAPRMARENARARDLPEPRASAYRNAYSTLIQPWRPGSG